MAFTKAKPMQSKLRVAFFGSPGSGKTFTSLLLAEGLAKRDGKRIAFVDTEVSGSDLYALPVPSRRVHPEAFDFDVLKTQSLAEMVRDVTALDPKVYGVIVLDSVSHAWEAAMNAAEQTSRGTVKFGEWTKVKRPYKRFIKWLIESPFHVIICGRAKNVFEEDEKGDTKKVGVTMNAERDTLYELQVAIQLVPKVNPKDPTQTTYMAYVEKDRSGVLAGRTLANLGYQHFEPILALLSGESAKLPDPEETALKDAELMESEDMEVREKVASKSRELLAVYSARMKDAEDTAALDVIARELKTKRASLIDEHYRALREEFDAKMATFQKKETA